jgi:hypothetical protein
MVAMNTLPLGIVGSLSLSLLVVPTFGQSVDHAPGDAASQSAQGPEASRTPAFEKPDGAIEPASGEGVPTIVVEETIPGPLTARAERIVYKYYSDRDRDRYLAAPHLYSYGGSFGYSRYYCDAFCGAQPGHSAFYPAAVYYGRHAGRTGRTALRSDHGGVRYGSRISGRGSWGSLHYCDGQHGGGISISIGSRYDRTHRRPPVTTLTRRHTTTGSHHSHALRPAVRRLSVPRGSSIGHIGRSSPLARTIRIGSRTTRSGLRTTRPGSREINRGFGGSRRR